MKEMTNCPNCGGAIEHSYNHKCPYCGTFLHITDRETQEINNTEIRGVKVELERNPIEAGYILRIRGYTSPKIYTYEETTEMGEIFSIDDVKPVGYIVKIPFDIVYESEVNGKPEKILDLVFKSLPKIFMESEEVYREIIEKIYDTAVKGWRL